MNKPFDPKAWSRDLTRQQKSTLTGGRVSIVAIILVGLLVLGGMVYIVFDKDWTRGSLVVAFCLIWMWGMRAAISKVNGRLESSLPPR